MTQFRQDEGQSLPGGRATRQAEAKQRRIPGEAPGPDFALGQRSMRTRPRHSRQTKQRRSAEHHEAVTQKDAVQRIGLLGEPCLHRFGPGQVGQGCRGNLHGCAGNRPRTERFAQGLDQGFRSDGKAQAQPGQAVELPERPKRDHGIIGQLLCERLVRHHIHEGLVNNQPTPAIGGRFRDGERVLFRDEATIGVVGMNQNRMADGFRKRSGGSEFLRRVASLLPRAGMFGVSRGRNANKASIRCKPRQPLDQGLCSRAGDDVVTFRNTIGPAGCCDERLQLIPAGQGRPEMAAEGPGRIGERRDAGGEVKPFLPAPAKPRHRLAKIAAMLHLPEMPWKRIRRQCSLAALTIFMAAPVAAQSVPDRIVSINMCTDQLLLDLARPEQIAGLSPFAADPLRSWAAGKAKPYPRLSGSAEEVLVLGPDLVVGGRFTRRSTREFIRQQGFRLEEFDAVRSIAETKAQILRMGTLVGNPARAQQRVAEIDAALARLRSDVTPLRLRILPVARRGWVSGSDSLMTDLLSQAGLANVAHELGFRQGGFASLESIVLLKPDVILVARDDLTPEDQGTAKLLHPALAGRFGADRKLTMPEKLTVCGGPMLVEAIEHLGREIVRIGRQ
jgi:iron complex transport system substrate-binding protein